MSNHRLHIRLLAACFCMFASIAHAQQLNPISAMMLTASQQAVAGQFKEAIDTYTQVIAMDKSYVDAYLQRGMLRRENSDVKGAEADATIAVQLAEAKLLKNPNHARSYYERGTGLRLLGRFDNAAADMRKAISLDPRQIKWNNDLQAILLEQKMAGAAK